MEELCKQQLDVDQLTIYVLWAGYMTDSIAGRAPAIAKTRIREQLYEMAKRGDVPKVAQGDLEEFLRDFQQLCDEYEKRLTA